MSDHDLPDSAAAADASHASVPSPAQQAARSARAASHRPGQPSRRAGTAIALVLALLACVACAALGWRQWRQMQRDAATGHATSELQQRVGALEATLAGVSGERTTLNQRLNDAAEVDRSLRDELLAQDARMRDLESAVAKLSANSQAGHDAFLLDEADALLRMAAQRYALFHDAQGAAEAYALADQTLAGVDNASFLDVRQSIQAERKALLDSQPVGQERALRQLDSVRASLPGLPLRSADAVGGAATGAWARLRRALGSVVDIRRDDGAPLAVADAPLARELIALDLVQAQSALLARDPRAYQSALASARDGMAREFDLRAPAVQQAQAQLASAGSALPASTSPVQLGAALNELRNLRAVHAASAVAPVNGTPAVKAAGATP